MEFCWDHHHHHHHLECETGSQQAASPAESCSKKQQIVQMRSWQSSASSIWCIVYVQMIMAEAN